MLGKEQKHVRAVDGVSFEVDRGEVFCLVGESGCGKTTTGKALLRLNTPTEGNIFFGAPAEQWDRFLGWERRLAELAPLVAGLSPADRNRAANDWSRLLTLSRRLEGVRSPKGSVRLQARRKRVETTLEVLDMRERELREGEDAPVNRMLAKDRERLETLKALGPQFTLRRGRLLNRLEARLKDAKFNQVRAEAMHAGVHRWSRLARRLERRIRRIRKHVRTGDVETLRRVAEMEAVVEARREQLTDFEMRRVESERLINRKRLGSLRVSASPGAAAEIERLGAEIAAIRGRGGPALEAFELASQVQELRDRYDLGAWSTAGGAAPTEKPTAAFVLSLIGGMLVLLVGTLLAAIGIFFGSLIEGLGGPPGAAGSLVSYAIPGIVNGLLIIIFGVLLYLKPARHVAWGTLLLLLSIASLVTTLGGLFIGLILGIIGAVLGIAWKPKGRSGKKFRERMRELRRRVQIIYQDPYESLNPKMSIYDIVSEPLLANRVVSTPSEAEAVVAKALEDVGLRPASEYMFRYPHELSGGQRQRVGIATALVVDPDFIVADEPVSMLDASVRTEILALLLDLKKRRELTYLFITHDLGLAWILADRIAVMYLGKIVETGNAPEIIQNPRHPYTKAMISVVPSPNPSIHRDKIILHGERPNPVDIPSGCRFHPRCPMAVGICGWGSEEVRQELQKLLQEDHAFPEAKTVTDVAVTSPFALTLSTSEPAQVEKYLRKRLQAVALGRPALGSIRDARAGASTLELTLHQPVEPPLRRIKGDIWVACHLVEPEMTESDMAQPDAAVVANEIRR